MSQAMRLARIASTAALVMLSCLAACGRPTSSSSTGSPGEPLCDTAECGPAIRMPSRRCPDGSIGGPTGRCLRKPDGRCAWEVRPCPPG
ncbi:MAG TPA: hypothetical protein VHT91_23085 [Kofleriaceae bacterium]|nr:hypothetical protein [Kofleriaceae bacterium]